MLNLSKIKVTRSLSTVVCATVLFAGSSVFAKGANVSYENDNVEVKYPSVSIDTNKMDEVIKILENILSGSDSASVKSLGGLIKTVSGLVKLLSTGNIQFDPSTIIPRVNLAKDVAKSIKVAASKGENGLYYKEQEVLTQFGLDLTGIVIGMVNPASDKESLAQSQKDLARILSQAQNGANMTDESVANTNVKEELETALRANRNLVLKKLLQVKSPAFSKFQKEILASTGARLNPFLTFGQTKVEIEKVKQSREAFLVSLNDLSDENKISTIWERETLAKKLRKARALKYGELKAVNSEALKELDKEILRITGVRLNPAATKAEVKKATLDLMAAIDKARNGETVAYASSASKKQLLSDLHKARFYKFNILSKKGWDANVKLDKVISSLNLLSINSKATQAQVDEALEKLNKAVEEAKALPNKW